MIDGRSYLPGTPIYTFVDEKGNNIHVDSELLRKWCVEHKNELEVWHTPVTEKIAISFLKENVIDPEHLVEVSKMKSLDPIIYGHTGTYTNGGPDVLLIDGHHRYVLAWASSMQFIPSYILKPEQWEPFQIINLPKLTREQLIAAPTKAAYLRSKKS